MASLQVADGSLNTLERSTVLPVTEARRETSGWLVGPWFDALLIANVAWPLVLLAQFGEGFSGREGVQFWQLYFVTTPHRWITLALVFLDRERFGQRKAAFLLVAALIAGACLTVRWTTGTLMCLLTIDYIWNAWHFAAQHHGIYRIYQRQSNFAVLSAAAVEKWSLRLFLLYVILRVAGATWSYVSFEQTLMWADWAVLAIPAWLVFRDLVNGNRRSVGRRLYLVSVVALYLALLAAVHFNRPALVLPLATASALFHATEYLALVGWAVQRRHAALRGQLGILGYLAPRWVVTVGIFLLVLGAGGWLLDRNWMKAWLLVNVVVAFMHYAYDGMIWRQGGARP